MKRLQLVLLGVLTTLSCAMAQKVNHVLSPVDKLTDNQPYIYYEQGDKDGKWCLVTEAGDRYKVLYGTGAEDYFVTDSVTVSSPALGWGLEKFAQVYKPAATETRASGRVLKVRSKDNQTVTAMNIDPNEYADDAAKQINDLYYTVYWLSSPKVQKTIATPPGLGVTKTSTRVQPVYHHKTTGFYTVVEFTGGISLGNGYHTDTKDHYMSFMEIDVAGGWKFSEKFGVGLGVGGRKYFNTNRMFAHSWGMPVYVDLRGDLTSYNIRKFATIWAFDLGYTGPDGFMFRPQIGAKFGQPYKFIVSLAYMGQFMRKYNYRKRPGGVDYIDIYDGFKRQLFSCACIRIGYEF